MKALDKCFVPVSVFNVRYIIFKKKFQIFIWFKICSQVIFRQNILPLILIFFQDSAMHQYCYCLHAKVLYVPFILKIS